MVSNRCCGDGGGRVVRLHGGHCGHRPLLALGDGCSNCIASLVHRHLTSHVHQNFGLWVSGLDMRCRYHCSGERRRRTDGSAEVHAISWAFGLRHYCRQRHNCGDTSPNLRSYYC